MTTNLDVRHNDIYRESMLIITSIIAYAFLFSSCSDERIAHDALTPDIEGMEIEMDLLVSVPSMSRYSGKGDTRSLPFDEYRESRITDVSLILFNQDTLGRSDDVAMVMKGKALKRDPLDSLIYRFKVSIYVPDPDDVSGLFNGTVIANCPEEAATIRQGMKYVDMKKSLVRRFASKGKEDYTPLLPKDNESPLPMWGEVSDVAFPSGDETSVPTYAASLLRSVARVDVTVDSEIEPEKFRIESIHVVNGANAMAIVPDSASLEPIENMPGHRHALRNTLPDGIGYNIRWDHDSVGIDNIISHTLYIPEADVRIGGRLGDENHTRRTAIVVGAHYEESDSLQYYRMDFYDEEADTLVNVRRNHLYTFHITKVDCEGAESVEAAYNDPIIDDFEASMIEWDLPHKSLTYSDNDWISASKETLHLTGNVDAGEVVEVKSTLPLSTFRVRWLENEETSYFKDRTESINGVEAEVEIKGDMARVAVRVTQENPAGNEPRLCRLSLRISPRLTIAVPVIVHPLRDPGWDDNHPMEF